MTSVTSTSIANPLKELNKYGQSVWLDYIRRSLITGLKRISRPGARAYLGSAEIRPVVGGLGISIMTTPKGLMSGRAARKAKIGGELLCEVW